MNQTPVPTLIFPALVRTGRNVTRLFGEDEYRYVIYKLDWKTFDDKRQELRNQRRATQRAALESGPIPGLEDLPEPRLMTPGIELLPEPWEERVTSIEFGLTQHYLEEIQRNAKRATDEWDHPTHFDTSTREMCLGAAITHVLIAFKLLVDCVWSEEQQQTVRNADMAYIATFALPYRFWLGQTGRGCVNYHAEVNQLFKHQEANDSWWQHCHSTDLVEFTNALRIAENRTVPEEPEEAKQGTRWQHLRGNV